MAQRFVPGRPHGNYRSSVRDPINPYITIPLIPISHRGKGTMELTVPAALNLIEQLTTQVKDFCKRADVADALHRTDPGPCNETLGL